MTITEEEARKADVADRARRWLDSAEKPDATFALVADLLTAIEQSVAEIERLREALIAIQAECQLPPQLQELMETALARAALPEKPS